VEICQLAMKWDESAISAFYEARYTSKLPAVVDWPWPTVFRTRNNQ
jgi:hypothetical protein